jgi:hypothetical protein
MGTHVSQIQARRILAMRIGVKGQVACLNRVYIQQGSDVGHVIIFDEEMAINLPSYLREFCKRACNGGRKFQQEDPPLKAV